MDPRRRVWAVLLLANAAGLLFGHSPVNIINSSDRPWFALAKPREGSLLFRTEHGVRLPAMATERRLAEGRKGFCRLEPGWVVSMQAEGQGTTCCASILLMDEAGGLSPLGMYHYLAPGPPAWGGRGMLRPLDDFGPTLKTVRQPERSVVQILGDAWPPALDRPFPSLASVQEPPAADPAPKRAEDLDPTVSGPNQGAAPNTSCQDRLEVGATD